MTKKAGSHHVVPNVDGGWDVKKDGATRSSGHFDKKQDAVDAGRKISQNQGTEFVIHGKDGTGIETTSVLCFKENGEN